MPPREKKLPNRLTLIIGQEFLVQQHTRKLVDSLVPAGSTDFGLEIIEATVSNATEALSVLARLTEAVNTTPFLGGEKVVWLKDCSFLGTDRIAKAQPVLEGIEELTELLKGGLPNGVFLVISATSVDERRGFYKTCEKQGEVIYFKPPKERSAEERAQIVQFIDAKLRAASKSLDEEARERFVELVGGDLRQLESELDKLITYVGVRKSIGSADVEVITSTARSSPVWDLTDAFAEHNLAKALVVLENLLNRGEKAMGLLFALVNKTRSLLILRDLLDRKIVQLHPGSGTQISARASHELPAERAFNPLLQHPYAVLKNLQCATRHSTAELINAQAIWLDTNQKLVTSALDEKLILQQALAKILRQPAERGEGSRTPT